MEKLSHLNNLTNIHFFFLSFFWHLIHISYLHFTHIKDCSFSIQNSLYLSLSLSLFHCSLVFSLSISSLYQVYLLPFFYLHSLSLQLSLSLSLSLSLVYISLFSFIHSFHVILFFKYFSLFSFPFSFSL